MHAWRDDMAALHWLGPHMVGAMRKGPKSVYQGNMWQPEHDSGVGSIIVLLLLTYTHDTKIHTKSLKAKFALGLFKS